jgi:hypothetical protein
MTESNDLRTGVFFFMYLAPGFAGKFAPGCGRGKDFKK